LNKLLYIL